MPAELAAWIAEKFHTWTDHTGDLETAVDRDRLHGDWHIPTGRTVDVPTGYAAFPREIRRPPRSIAEQCYTDIRRWTPMEKGRPFRGDGATGSAGAGRPRLRAAAARRVLGRVPRG